MQTAVLSFNPSKKLMISFFIFLSVLLAAYTPMASISSAQSAIDASKLEQLKTKAIDAINQRLKSFQTTLANLSVNVSVSKSGASASVNTASTSPSPSTSVSPSVSLSKSGLEAAVNFPNELKDKAKAFLQKIVDELKTMKDKVSNASSLTSAQSLTSNLDAQSGLGQLTNVQAAVTQAVQSLAGVFGNLKTTANSLQSRITQLKECSDSSSSATADDCAGLNTTNSEVATTAQSQMDNIGTIMSTISSMLMTGIALLTTLLTSFGGMTGGLGSLGSLGNIGNLSNLTSLGDISSMAGGLGGISGLLTSFTGLSSQLDIANGMSGNLGGLLGNLSGLVNI